MQNRIEHLRNHLFLEIERLQESATPADLARAKTVAELGQTIVNTAKVEVDMIRAIDGSTAPAFFEPSKPLTLTAEPARPRLLKGRVSRD